jgi:hypothetical protein
VKTALSRGLSFLVGALALFSLWYLWALFPVLGQPPGVGALFTKQPTVVSTLMSELRVGSTGKTRLPIVEIEKACKPSFLLKPLQGPADHVVLEVTAGVLTAARNVSCKTHMFSGPWRTVP